MNEVKQLLSKYNYKIERVLLNNNVIVIDTDNNRFVVKKKNNSDINEIFKYLSNRKFNNYLEFINDLEDEYMIFPYLKDNFLDKNEKAKDIISLVSMLHSKTTFYKEFYKDEIKEIYENSIDKIDELYAYYNNIRLVIEESEFISPSNYFLLRNISWIFYSLNSSKHFIEKWYEVIKEKKSKRICLIHGNLELDHILGEENKFLISWDKAHNEMPIYDLLYFYKKHYYELDFYELFHIYEDIYPFTNDERYLLFCLMLIPDKLIFDKEEILNTRDVFYMIKYLNISNNIVSKYHPTNSDSKTNKFNK